MEKRCLYVAKQGVFWQTTPDGALGRCSSTGASGRCERAAAGPNRCTGGGAAGGGGDADAKPKKFQSFFFFFFLRASGGGGDQPRRRRKKKKKNHKSASRLGRPTRHQPAPAPSSTPGASRIIFQAIRGAMSATQIFADGCGPAPWSTIFLFPPFFSLPFPPFFLFFPFPLSPSFRSLDPYRGEAARSGRRLIFKGRAQRRSATIFRIDRTGKRQTAALAAAVFWTCVFLFFPSVEVGWARAAGSKRTEPLPGPAARSSSRPRRRAAPLGDVFSAVCEPKTHRKRRRKKKPTHKPKAKSRKIQACGCGKRAAAGPE